MMRIFGKIVIDLLFFVFFVAFLLVTSLYFQVLNKSFLFSTFEKYQVYQKVPQLLTASLPNDPNLKPEERQMYTQIAQQIPPSLIKKIVEENLTKVLDFLHGKASDLVISFPIIEPGVTVPKNMNWSLSQNLDPNARKQFAAANGITKQIFIAWTIILFVLICLFFLYGRLTVPKSITGGKRMLVIIGSLIVFFVLIAKLFLFVVGGELSKGIEPSQKLLGLVFSSLLPEITTLWLVLGCLLIFLWIIFYFLQRNIASRIDRNKRL